MRRMMKFSLVVLFSVIFAGFMFFYYLFMPIGVQDETVKIVISPGTPIGAIVDSLRTHDVITSRKALLIWLRITGTANQIQAGRFRFLEGEGVLSASEKLLDAEPIEKAVTINEGLTMEQTAGRYTAEMQTDSAEFVRLCNDPDFIKGTGIKAKSLEGYLFPDTYRFPEESREALIIRKMVSRFHEAYATVKGDNDIMEKYSMHEIVTLASIVEKEATLASERGRIAGVFHNRLELGYPLGADPTVRYIFRKFSGPLLVSELKSDSPYNTRRFTGLPPGPICSPGLAAIQASTNPDSTDELYFVARWDGTGAHDFSKTNAEHERKKLKIRRQNELRKKMKGLK
ncbi:MAG: endolytic transglycosylase MltG [Chitinispirillaceae bacterium]